MALINNSEIIFGGPVVNLTSGGSKFIPARTLVLHMQKPLQVEGNIFIGAAKHRKDTQTRIFFGFGIRPMDKASKCKDCRENWTHSRTCRRETYRVGGTNGTKDLDDGAIYDITSGNWSYELAKSPLGARFFHSSGVYQSKFIVWGGESLDGAKKRWSYV